MPAKTPKFWYKDAGLYAALLSPLAGLYQIGHRISQRFQPKPYKSHIPVICIGNAVAGGSGKTPTAIALMRLITANELYQNPVFVTRGYGGTKKEAYEVDVDSYKVSESGDEAYLLAQNAPTIIAKNRADGAKLAEKMKADLIIMDDGLLNNSLHKNISIMVIDRMVDFGNGKTIPAGPLREPLTQCLPKIDAIISIGAPLKYEKPVFEAKITAKEQDLKGSYIAFAGLGRPEKFLQTLEDLKLDLVGWREFADHHPYTLDEIKDLLKEADDKDAELITTEKDHIRLPKTLQKKVKTLPIKLELAAPNTLVDFLKASLK